MVLCYSYLTRRRSHVHSRLATASCRSKKGSTKQQYIEEIEEPMLSSHPFSVPTFFSCYLAFDCEPAGRRQELEDKQEFLSRVQEDTLLSHRIDRESVAVVMMAMGYFRAPRRLYGRKPAEREHQQRENAALLVDDYQGEAAAAAGAVPKGYFAVYVGAESRRFVVRTSYLSQPAFRELMERAAEEFGFAQAGGLRIPCREEDFQATVAALEQSRRRGGGGGGGRARGSAAAGPTRWARAS